MARLFGIILILFLLLSETLPINAQNPFLKGDQKDISQTSVLPNPFLTKIATWQQELNQKMAALTKEAEKTGSLRPLLSLVLIAFAYGALHAAGPGHGKAVATSYLVSQGRKLVKGILLGNLIALFHGFSGVILVLAVHFIIRRSVSGSLEAATSTTQIISYSLIALLGMGLLIKNLVLWFRQGEILESNYPIFSGSKKKHFLVMAFVVGMIPCPGTALIMLFCLSMNLVGLGLLLTLFLILGMAVTISTVGVVAVASKKLVLSAVQRKRRLAWIMERSIESTAAVMVTVLGLIFLAATI